LLDRTGKKLQIAHVNTLNVDSRKQILAALVEGKSMLAISRIGDVSRNTVNKLLIDLGTACSVYQNKVFRNLKCKRIQLDEIWCFVACEQKNVSPDNEANGWGDVWIWVALDPETKLVPTWFVGNRDASAAYHFMHDLKPRLAHRVQLTTDGVKCYLEATEDTFCAEVDFAQLAKIYGPPFGPHASNPEVQYSSAQGMGARKSVITGNPDFKHISSSQIERQNSTVRMSEPRFTPSTNAFSKKLGNHEHSVAVHYMYYNFGRIHQSLRVTPAMEAGIADHVWNLEEIISLLP
jgi:IS1 family transposase